MPEDNIRKIKIVKNWDDTEAQKTKRPNSIMTTVTGGGNTYNVGVAEGQGWQTEVSVRNYDDNGDRIEYEVRPETKWLVYYHSDEDLKRLKSVFGITGISRKFEVYFRKSDNFWDR